MGPLDPLALVSEPRILRTPCSEGCRLPQGWAVGFLTVRVLLPDEGWTTLPVALCDFCLTILVHRLHTHLPPFGRQVEARVHLSDLICPRGSHRVTLFDLVIPEFQELKSHTEGERVTPTCYWHRRSLIPARKEAP